MIKRITAASAAVACALGAALFTAAPASAVGEAVQLQEVQILGSAGDDDEFVAFENTTGSAIVIDNYKIEVVDASDTVIGTYTVPNTTPDTSLPAGDRWFVRGDDYSGTVSSDGSFDFNLVRTGGLILKHANGTVLDKVAFGELVPPSTIPQTGATSAREGDAALTSPDPNPGNLAHLKVDDTDDNFDDWTLAPRSVLN